MQATSCGRWQAVHLLASRTLRRSVLALPFFEVVPKAAQKTTSWYFPQLNTQARPEITLQTWRYPTQGTWAYLIFLGR